MYVYKRPKRKGYIERNQGAKVLRLYKRRPTSFPERRAGLGDTTPTYLSMVRAHLLAERRAELAEDFDFVHGRFKRVEVAEVAADSAAEAFWELSLLHEGGHGVQLEGGRGMRDSLGTL